MSILSMGNRRPGLTTLLFSILVIAVVAPKPAEAISCTTLNNKSRYHQREGQRYFREKQFVKAEREFTDLLYYMRKGKKKATGLLRGCTFTSRERFYRDYSMAYTWRGVSRYFQAKFTSAIKDYRVAIRKNAKNDLAHYMLGITYMRTRNKSAAMEQYRILKNWNSKYAPKLYRIINP